MVDLNTSNASDRAYMQSQLGLLDWSFAVEAWEWARLLAPALPVPVSGVIYVSGPGATSLPAGSDSNNGTQASPYATISMAFANVPLSGDYIVEVDGFPVENTDGLGYLHLKKNFVKPVVVRSYQGSTSTGGIKNASGANGVIAARGNRANNVFFSKLRIEPTTDQCPAFRSNPSASGNTGSNIKFFDCVLVGRSSAGASIGIIDLATDWGVAGLHLVRCAFERMVGGATTFDPVIISTRGTTLTVDVIAHTDIGFWDCYTTDSNWRAFGPTAGVYGIDTLTIVRCNFKTSFGQSILVGKDTANDATPKVYRAYVADCVLEATGSNPHAMVIGSNVQAPVVKRNVSISGLQGIVLKGCLNAEAAFNKSTVTATSANGSAIYAKASVGSYVHDNEIVVDGSAFAVNGFREDVDNGTKASGTVMRSNKITAAGVNAKAVLWIDGSGSAGGGVSDKNGISLANGAALGSVRGVTVTTAAEMRAAWASAALAGDGVANDAMTFVKAA